MDYKKQMQEMFVHLAKTPLEQRETEFNALRDAHVIAIAKIHALVRDHDVMHEMVQEAVNEIHKVACILWHKVDALASDDALCAEQILHDFHPEGFND